MLQDGRIIAVDDLSKAAPRSVVTGYRPSPTKSNHQRWDHYNFSSPGKRMEFRLYGRSTGDLVTEATSANGIPSAWRYPHDYEIGTIKFDPSVLVSSDGVVFVNERLVSELDAWETANRVKSVVPRLYGNFLNRQSNGWFYAVVDLSDPQSGKIARFRTELPANANYIDYMHAWGGATFFVGGRLDVQSLESNVNSPANPVTMGSGDTDPSGILKSSWLFVTKSGRLAVESGLYMEMKSEGRLGALSETAFEMHRKLEAGLQELYG